jgi:predicted dinucleotide-binding enzyme
MKIGIIGSGDVARALAAGLLRHGHSVRLGTSDPARLAGWKAQHPGAEVGSFAEAADFAELAVLAVKGTAAIDAVRLSGPAALAGKTVIDTCNPIADVPPQDGVFSYFTDPNMSLMEALQAEFPALHFVKAFNSVGAGQMVNPQMQGGAPTMFIAGNDTAAKAQVGTLLTQLGWETADMGRAAAARAIEPLCMLWCIPGLLRNEWAHAFKLVRPA